jgi:bifunctional DNA-binding transcriptional regulator/antitoxin component of YhaV-PrlF toxin-antitoxin module
LLVISRYECSCLRSPLSALRARAVRRRRELLGSGLLGGTCSAIENGKWLKPIVGKTGFNMEIKIDKAGRIVVPKPLRERPGFRQDTELEAIERPEGVLLKRVEQRRSMTKTDGLWLHQGIAERGASWGRVLEKVREERIKSALQA